MQPFEYVILLFVLCLLHGIYRAMQDVKREAAQAYFDVLMKITRKEFPRITIAFNDFAKCGQVRDGKELHSYFSSVDYKITKQILNAIEKARNLGR